MTTVEHHHVIAGGKVGSCPSDSSNGSQTAGADEIYQDPHSAEISQLINYDGNWMIKLVIPDRQKLNEVKRFQIQPTDVLVVSFPKSGTTWMQNIILKMVAQMDNGNKKTDDRNLEDRFPMIEYNHSGSESLYDSVSPRLLKSHMPYHLLPSDVHNGLGKVIYIGRNPKDTLVSLYHYTKNLITYEYTGKIEDMYEDFIKGRVMYGPWPEHVKSYWTQRNQKNILFLTYEQLHERPIETLKSVADFLSWPLTETQLMEVAKVTEFKTMRTDSSVNYQWYKDYGVFDKDGNHLRKGIVGDWRNHLTEEMSRGMDTELLNPLKDLGLKFDC